MIYFGTSTDAALEAIDYLAADGIPVDGLRVRAFPFHSDVEDFIDSHDSVFVVEQNRDAQMRTLLMTESGISPDKLLSVLNIDGMPMTASDIISQVKKRLPADNVTPIHRETAEQKSR